MRSWYVLSAVLVLMAIFWPFSFAYTSMYVFVGCVVFGKLWARSGRRCARVEFRVSHPRVFHGERAEVQLGLLNLSFLPLTWAEVSVRLPVAFQEGGIYRELVNVPRRGKFRLTLDMACDARGLFFLGPVKVCSGDIFGFGRWEKEYPELLRFVVYPKVVPLEALGIPARQPLGSLRTGYRVFEDITRFSAIRDYVAGDPIKRIDWKATARVRKLQVRTYDPTITMSTAIFLNLNRDDYAFKFGADYMELGVTVAASLANYVASLGQEVSFVTNGADPLGYMEETVFAAVSGADPRGGFLEASGVSSVGSRPAGSWGSRSAPTAAGTDQGARGEGSSRAASQAEGTEGPSIQAPRACISVPFQRGHEQLVRILEVLARIRPSEKNAFLGMVDNCRDVRLPWGATLVFVVPSESEELLQELIRFKRAGHNVVLVLLYPLGERAELGARCKSLGIVLHQVGKEADLDAFRARRSTVA